MEVIVQIKYHLTLSVVISERNFTKLQ